MSNELSVTPTTPSALMYVDPSAVAAAESAKAQIQAAYIMAMQKPRSYDLARVRILEACKRPAFAPKVQYNKPIGSGKTVSGGSIRFAEMLSREWGNILIKDTVVYDDETTRRISVTAIDLETNATLSKDIQLAKTVERAFVSDREVLGERTNSSGKKTYIVRATEDEMQIKQESAVSKAKRNLIIALIPQEITEEAMEVATNTMSSEHAANPGEARRKLVDLFYNLGVKPTDIEDYLDHPITSCVPAELVELQRIYTAIKDGDARWVDFTRKNDDGSFTSREEAKSVTEKILGNGDAGMKAKTDARPAPKDVASPSVDVPVTVAPASADEDLLDRLVMLVGPDFLDFTHPNRMKLAQAASDKRVTEIDKLTSAEIEKAIAIAEKEIDKRGIGA